MKIVLYIDMMDRTGAQRVMGNLAEYLVSKEYEVVMVNDFRLDPSIPQYELPPEVKRVYLREKLSGNPIQKNIQRIRNLREVVKKENPEIVLSFLGHPNIRMLIATLGLGVKKIVSVRNDPNREYGAGGVKKWFARQLFKLADGCVFQTEDAAQYFPESVRKKSRVIFNPVAPKFFDTTRKQPFHNIITAGRMELQKNQKILIKAFSEIAADFPDEKLIIYGDGPLRPELAALCKELNVDDQVEMPGNVADIEKILAETKLFILPSNYEGMPNALMEAMAVGVPVVATNCPCGGPRSLIESDEQGLLVPCGDATAMAGAIRKILCEEHYRNRMGAKAKERALQFRPDVILKQWEEYLLKDI